MLTKEEIEKLENVLDKIKSKKTVKEIRETIRNNQFDVEPGYYWVKYKGGEKSSIPYEVAYYDGSDWVSFVLTCENWTIDFISVNDIEKIGNKLEPDI